MESRFGHDFGRVRVHADARAAASAEAVGARAYAVGRHVVFSAGRYSPGTTEGRRLLAHELTHTVQQSGEEPSAAALDVAPASSASEREAETVAERVAGGRLATVAQRGRPAVAGAWDWERAGAGALTGGAIGGVLGGIASIFLGPAAFFIGLGVGALVGGLVGGLTGEPETTVTMEGPTGPNQCGVKQHRKIFPAVHRSMEWLRAALRRLRAFIAQPAARDNQPVQQQLHRHFRSATPAVSQHVAGRLQRIHDEMTSRQNFTVECHDASDSSCTATSAYVSGASLVFCPAFFQSDDGEWHAEALIHEWAHALTAGSHITDRAYRADRLYEPALARGLTTAEALTNAESYAVLTRELATGRLVSVGGPVDRIADCPREWIQPLRLAVARAQRWNRNAQTAAADTRSTGLAGWSDLQQVYLGGTTAAHIAPARRAYDSLETRLGEAVDLACESDPRRCGTANYRLDDETIRLCPGWIALAEADRVVVVLEALYERYAGVANPTQRANYARLARDLNGRFWAAPTLPQVLGGGT